MPAARFVLVFDRLGAARGSLLARGPDGGGVGELPAGETLRNDVADLVRPAFFMSDDPIDDMRHDPRSLLSRLAAADPFARSNGGFRATMPSPAEFDDIDRPPPVSRPCRDDLRVPPEPTASTDFSNIRFPKSELAV